MNEAVQQRIDKALENLAAIPVLIGDEFYAIAVNRAYYAMFCAVQALFLTDEIHVKTHKGMQLKFDELYVRSGKLPAELAIMLARTEDLG